MSKQHQIIASLAAVVLQAALIGTIPYLMYDWYLTTPDAGGWACGAQTLADTGQFSDGRTANLGYNFNICWTETTYPALQYFLAGLTQLTHLPAYQLVPAVMIVALIITCLALWGIGYHSRQSLAVATTAGLIGSITPIALRALILTPQNLIGYCLITLLLLLLTEIVLSHRHWLWIGVALIAVVLDYGHALSFGIAGLSCAIWFVVFYLPHWKWSLLTVGVTACITVVLWQLHWLPAPVTLAIGLFENGHYAGYDHPLYDHPAFLGYGLVALAAIGLWLVPGINKKIYWLVVCWLIVPLILGHLSWFGLSLMPDRFVAYIWISIALLAAWGINQLRTLLPWPAEWWLGFCLLIWVAQFSHTIVYIGDDIEGWSRRFEPDIAFTTALHWLNEQPDKGILVGIMAVSNREITFAPVWYDGPITSYPWYNLNHRKLKKFTPGSGLYRTVFTDPTNPEYLRVQAFYTIIAKPKSTQAKAVAIQYNLAYLIMRKGSQADRIWQNSKQKKFTQIYENERYRLYSLR